jgi:hypothetical protein
MKEHLSFSFSEIPALYPSHTLDIWLQFGEKYFSG